MQNGNLLIIDDEPLLLENLKFYLGSLADTISLASNGDEALKLISEGETHCILCDINMPIMNGVELLQQIRASGLDIPFIFYTGHGSHELMQEAVKYGAFDFLEKPSLNGMKEVITRGLRKGMGKEDEECDFMSEYRMLLK